MRRLTPGAALALLIPPGMLAGTALAAPAPYDEGAAAHYRRVRPIRDSLSADDLAYIESSSRETGSDRRRLLPVPRVLSREEHEGVVAGARQRAQTFWKLYEDLASGTPNAVRAGILPEAFVHALLRRHGYKDLRLPPPDRSAVYYGPDVARVPGGGFRVMEDNFGYLGGRADSTEARKDLLHLAPAYREVFTAERGRTYAQVIAGELRKLAHPQDGIVVMLLQPAQAFRQRHFIRQLREAGVIVPLDGETLTETPGGLFLKTAAGALRVGGVAFGDPGHPFASDPDVHGVARLRADGASLVLGDKALLQYVDGLTRFYLAEEPILPTLSTWGFQAFRPDAAPELDRARLEEVFARVERYVIKDVRLGQGKGVRIGGRIPSPEDKARLKEAVAREPGFFVAQEYVPMSRLEDYLVSLRPLAVVSAKGVELGSHLWGTGVHVSGDGRTNMSQEGVGVAVFTDGTDSVPEGTSAAAEVALARLRRLPWSDSGAPARARALLQEHAAKNGLAAHLRLLIQGLVALQADQASGRLEPRSEQILQIARELGQARLGDELLRALEESPLAASLRPEDAPIAKTLARQLAGRTESFPKLRSAVEATLPAMTRTLDWRDNIGSWNQENTLAEAITQTRTLLDVVEPHRRKTTLIDAIRRAVADSRHNEWKVRTRFIGHLAEEVAKLAPTDAEIASLYKGIEFYDGRATQGAAIDLALAKADRPLPGAERRLVTLVAETFADAPKAQKQAMSWVEAYLPLVEPERRRDLFIRIADAFRNRPWDESEGRREFLGQLHERFPAQTDCLASYALKTARTPKPLD